MIPQTEYYLNDKQTTYTRSEVQAIIEKVKERCALEAEVRSLEDDSHYVYEWIVDEQSIMKINTNDLLNK